MFNARSRCWLMCLTLAICWCTAPPLSWGQNLAESLEQAIYAEETQGDLKKAIQLYQKVVADAASTKSIAAQAQLRLAKCLLKQGNTAEANQAFATLIKDYPEEKDLVAEARKHVDTGLQLVPAPWKDGEVQQLVMRLPNGQNIGTTFATVHARQDAQGNPQWLIRNRSFVSLGNVHSISEVLVDGTAMRPLKSLWRHTLLGDAEAQYGDDNIVIQYRNKPEPQTVILQSPVMDNEEVIQVMRRLPLAADYVTTIHVLPILTGTLVPIEFKVSQEEKVKTPAGEFDCYRVDLNIQQSFWYSRDEHRYLVKFEAGGVEALLERVFQMDENRPTDFSVDEFGLQLALPPHWFVTRDEEAKDRLIVNLIDDSGAALIRLEVFAKDDQQSLEQFMEADIEKGRKIVPDVQKDGKLVPGFVVQRITELPRPTGVQEFVGYVARGKLNGKDQVRQGLFFQGEKFQGQLTSLVPAEQWNGVEKKLHELFSSIRLK